MGIQKVGIVGCGLMGSGIAQVTSLMGFETVVREASGELPKQGLQRIEEAFGYVVSKQKISSEVRVESEARWKILTRQ